MYLKKKNSVMENDMYRRGRNSPPIPGRDSHQGFRDRSRSPPQRHFSPGRDGGRPPPMNDRRFSRGRDDYRDSYRGDSYGRYGTNCTLSLIFWLILCGIEDTMIPENTSIVLLRGMSVVLAYHAQKDATFDVHLVTLVVHADMIDPMVGIVEEGDMVEGVRCHFENSWQGFLIARLLNMPRKSMTDTWLDFMGMG